jgi:subtilase family serine protease
MHAHAATSSSLSGFVTTLTKAFPSGIVRDLGVANTTLPMHITVSLVTRNDSAIPALLMRQNTPGDSMYHHYLTPQQSMQMFSPSLAQVQAVESYLTSNGFSNVTASADNELVMANGTVATVNAAFQTAEHAGLFNGKAILINSAPAQVPASLSGTVRAILGVHQFPAQKMLKYRPAGSSCTENPVNGVCVLNDFTPRDFWLAYDARGPYAPGDGTSGYQADYHDGINTNIAIFAEGDLAGVLPNDLRQFENINTLPPTSYQIVPETGFNSTDTSGADEFDLDTQMSSSMAGNVKRLDVYDANSLDDDDLIVDYDLFKTNDVDAAASASYGGCESLEETGGDLQSEDAIFAEAAVQGQTVFASSGDSGTGCLSAENGVPAGVPGVEYPASSEYVVGAGGTSLFTTATDFYQGEISWDSGGGGLSLFETPGPWQSPVSTYATAGERGVPDVAMDADPNISGADVIVAGAPEIIGGTSLSSPLSLGVWARLETQSNNVYGFAAPVLYKEFNDLGGSATTVPGGYTRTVGGFNDVVVGSNGLPATEGYDLTTGLGSFDIYDQIVNIGK